MCSPDMLLGLLYIWHRELLPVQQQIFCQPVCLRASVTGETGRITLAESEECRVIFAWCIFSL